MGYQLEGRLLEVCNCNVLCPCWIGEDPDNGTCDSINAYQIDRGTIDGVDVAGRTVALVNYIPGNVLAGNWRVLICLDEGTTAEQQEALLNVWTGKRGGPLADLAQLVGEVIGVERMPITFTVKEGKGTLKIGAIAEAEMAPYVGATGQTTTLNESLFSTIPGSPTFVSKAATYQRRTARYGLADMNLEGHNAIQGHSKFAA